LDERLRRGRRCVRCGLQLDADADPTRPPHLGFLATGMRFGGDGLYRDRLVAPPGRARCVPNPLGRQRRLVIRRETLL
jgi:hypothetical protein